MPSGLSKKISALRESIEDRFAGRDVGKFGEVENPAWARTTMGDSRIRDSPESKSATLLYLPSSTQGPLRFVLHNNILSGVAGPSHRIVALNRNGRLKGELIFTCFKDMVSIDALNSEKQNAGMGRSLVLLFAQNLPPEKKKITVHAAAAAIPFYASLGFRRLGEKPVERDGSARGPGGLSKAMQTFANQGARGTSPGGQLMVCTREELFRNKDEIARTGARKGKVFVR